MSTEPVEQLLDGVADCPVLSNLVEAHLDEHGFEVDPSEVDRIARRLERRIHTPHRRMWIGAATLIAAAAAAWLLLPLPRLQTTTSTAIPVVEAQVLAPALSSPVMESPIRRVVVAPGSRVLVSETPRTTVVLVQEGSVSSGSTTVPEKTWLLVTEGADGHQERLVFPDGTSPPPLHEDIWEAGVHQQLRKVRWQSLPSRSLDALDSILEK